MRSLVFRMLVPVLATMLALYLAVFGWILFDARRRALAEAETRARETAVRCAMQVSAYVERALQIPRTMAAEFTGLVRSGVPPQRGELNAMLRQSLEIEPDVLALYTLWEPDALDGRDAEFVGTPGHDASGRFIPYWHRAAGEPVLEPLLDYEQEGRGDYYLIPRRTERDAWIEPYRYPVADREVLITSLVCPVMVDGQFRGITGLDFDLETLTEMVGAIHPYGRGYAVLLSAEGVVVAHPDRGRLGRRLADHDPTAAIAAAGSGAEGEAVLGFSDVLDARAYYVSAAVDVRGVPQRWRLVVAVPQSAVMGSATGQVLQVMLAGTVLASMLGWVLWRTARSLARELLEVSATLHGGANDTAAAVRQLVAEGGSLSSGAERQAAAMEQTGAALAGLVDTARRSRAGAETASTEAAATRQEAEAGAEAMARMQASLACSRDAADQVARIIKTIDEIAFQTNLLALNAAVEAARAGAHGAGFAVVADEVRSLSKRAAAATQESGGLIERSQAASRAAEDAGAAVADRFGHILGRNRQLATLLDDVRSAAVAQSDAIDSIAEAMRRIGAVTETNASSAAETAAAARQLEAQAAASAELAGRLLAVVLGGTNVAEGRVQ